MQNIFKDHVNAKRYPASSIICGNDSGERLEYAKNIAKTLLSSSLDVDLHPDLKIIEKEEGVKFIQVEQVRAIAEFLSYSASLGGNKVVIINSAENMNKHSSNALLKILEEPPLGSYIILTTSGANKLLNTIISRCHIYHIPKISLSEFENYFKNKQEALEINILAELSGVNVTIAKALIENKILDVYKEFYLIIASLHKLNYTELSEKLEKLDVTNWECLCKIIAGFFSNLLKIYNNEMPKSITTGQLQIISDIYTKSPIESYFDLWDKYLILESRTEIFNLDKKQALFLLFKSLKENLKNE